MEQLYGSYREKVMRKILLSIMVMLLLVPSIGLAKATPVHHAAWSAADKKPIRPLNTVPKTCPYIGYGACTGARFKIFLCTAPDVDVCRCVGCRCP